MTAPKLHVRIASPWGSYDVGMMEKLILSLKSYGVGVRVNDCTLMYHNLDISAHTTDQLEVALKLASVAIDLNPLFIQWSEGRKPRQETFHRWFNWNVQPFFNNPTPWKR
jgi:hypothetical protein